MQLRKRYFVFHETEGVKLMICKHCGAQNDDGAFICSQCGNRLDRDDNQNQNYNYGYSQQNYGQPSDGGQNYNNSQQSYESNQGNNGFDPNAQNQNGGYTYNYNQNYNYAPVNTSVLKKGSIIAALVVAILTRSVVAIVLAIIALVRCNEFETAVRTGNYPLADQKRDSANSLRKWAWAFCIIGIIISIVIGVLYMLGIGLGIFGEFLFPLGDEFFSEFDDFGDFTEMMINFIR